MFTENLQFTEDVLNRSQKAKEWNIFTVLSGNNNQPGILYPINYHFNKIKSERRKESYRKFLGRIKLNT